MADLNDLTARMSALEERMNTARAETETAFERLRADNEKLRADLAARDTRMFLTVLAIVGFGVAVLGFLIGLPQ